MSPLEWGNRKRRSVFYAELHIVGQKSATTALEGYRSISEKTLENFRKDARTFWKSYYSLSHPIFFKSYLVLHKNRKPESLISEY